MNTCGTCKYFGKPLENDHDVPTGYHVCELIEHALPYEEPPAMSTAVVVDGSGYYAALCVKEEFGCNQWAPK